MLISLPFESTIQPSSCSWLPNRLTGETAAPFDFWGCFLCLVLRAAARGLLSEDPGKQQPPKSLQEKKDPRSSCNQSGHSYLQNDLRQFLRVAAGYGQAVSRRAYPSRSFC